MSLEDVKAQLEHQNREQERTTDSIEALRTMFMERFKMEDRGKLDEMEALKEAKGKGSKAAPERRDKAKAEASGFNPLAMLNSLALPSLVALGASLSGFDAAIKALKIPDYISSISRALTSVSDMFSTMSTKATDLVDEIKLIRLPSLPEIDIPKLKVTLPDSWSTLGTKITTAIGDALPKVEDIKIPRIIFPDFPDITVKLPKMPEVEMPKLPKLKIPDIELPRLPELKIPEKITDFFDSIRAFNKSVVDFVAPKVPKFELLNADGTPFKFPELKLPEGLKGLKFPDMSAVKTFFVGTEAGGGIVGFLTSAAEMVGKIPGVSMIARIVGGPVTQAIISIIDFFTGFYKGFTEVELDEDGNEITKSFGDKMLAGIEGGLDGVMKGIVEGFQLLFVELPKWLLTKAGLDMSWMDNIDLWAIISPVWEFIKGIPKFLFSKEYRDEQIEKFKGLFTGEDGVVGKLKNFFSELFDFIPSIKDIKARLYALLPDWMKTTAEDLKKDLAELDEKQDRDIKYLQDTRGADFDLTQDPGQFKGQTKVKLRAIQQRIKRREEILKELDTMGANLAEGALGGQTSSRIGALGHLMKIHKNELIVPLDSSPQGQALKKLSKVLNVTASEMQNAQREYSSMAGTSMPTIVNNIVDNSTKQSSSIHNRSSFTAPPVTVDASLPVGLV